MPVGTVRGRFELDAPALRTLKELERQGIRTQAQMKSLGETMDGVGGPADVQRLRDYRGALDTLGRDSADMHRSMRRDWAETTRIMRYEIDRERVALRELKDDLAEIDRVRATPTIDIDGVTEAIAQVDLLQRKLNSLDRQRATPTVSGGGGGGALSPRGQSSFAGGGRGGLLSRAGHLGPRQLLMGAAAAYAQPLVGAATSLASSAVGAGLGAGALGIAGAGGLAVGVGGTFLIAKPTITLIQNAAKAQQAYNQAVADYGRRSTEAATAKRKLDVAMASGPRGTRQVLRAETGIRSAWMRDTAPGRNSLMRGALSGLGFGQSLLPAASASANRSAGAVAREAGNLERDPYFNLSAQRGLRTGAGIFNENLGNVRQDAAYSMEAAVNIMRASRPYLHDAMQFITAWVRGWSTSTRDIDRTRGRIGGMVDDLRAWVHMAGAAYRLVRDIGRDADPAGRNAVGSITDTLNTWDRWIQRNPRQVQEFFRNTTRSTGQLAQAIGQIARELGHLSNELQPVVNGLSSLVNFAGGAGLLTPGVGSGIYGFLRGTRGAGGGRGGGGLIMGGRGGRGGGGGSYGAAAAVAAAAGAPGVIALGPGYAAERRARLEARRVAAGLPPRSGMAGPLQAGWLTPREPGRASVAYNLSRGFGYGRVGSAGAALGALIPGRFAGYGSRAGSVAMRGLRGAGSTLGPVLALQALLAGSAEPGTAAERLQAALASTSFGLLAPPTTSLQARQQGFGRAAGVLSQYGDPTTAGGARSEIATLRARAAALRAASARHEGMHPSVLGIRLPRALVGLGPEEVQGRREAAQALGYQRAINSLMQQEVTLRHQRAQLLDERSVIRGRGYAAQFQQGFQTRSRREGVAAAFGDTTQGVLAQMHHMRSAGARELAQDTLAWANTVKQKNPALTKQYDALVQGIESRFRDLHGKIVVINGQILDGSTKQWNAIADQLASAARRGVDETSQEFQRLQAVAVGDLEAMGYSRKDAQGVFRDYKSVAAGGQLSGRSALGAARGINAAGQRGQAQAKAYARAGDGPGFGRSDMGGPGPMGPGAAGPAVTSSGLMGADPNLLPFDRIARRFGLHVTSGLRPGAITASGNVSMHSSGHAIDESGSAQGMLAYAKFMADHYGGQLNELIHTPLGYGIKNGKRVPLSFWGPAINQQHYSHVHVGEYAPSGVRGGPLGGGDIGGVGGISLHGRRSRLGGVPGMMSTAASGAIAKGMQDFVNNAIGAGGGGASGSYHGPLNHLFARHVGSGGATLSPAQVARIASSVGLPGRTFAQIAHGESGYQPGIQQPDPGNGMVGYGLFQITPNSWGRGSAAWRYMQSLGGIPAMFNPVRNAMMAKYLYDQAGHTISPWYGTKYVTGDGGQRGFASRRTISRPALGGGGGVNVHISMGHITVREHADIHRLSAAVADRVGAQLLAALGGPTDPMDD